MHVCKGEFWTHMGVYVGVFECGSSWNLDRIEFLWMNLGDIHVDKGEFWFCMI